MRGRQGHRHRPRSRHATRHGDWAVRARVERFVEPALLLLLRERPMHGYELIERVPEVAGEDVRVDVGNLYRILRALDAVADGRPFWPPCELREGGAPAWTSSKCWSRSCREASVRPQQAKSFMKLASSLGRYDEEW